ncbi:aspartic peptidase domain-containing protein [Xylariaceae sp. FL0255]|nr:aspartic peptidase domain-containing protein [Xylariaceae sp. FL0255]
MVATTYALTAAALAGLAAAQPVSTKVGTFSVPQVANPFFKASGPIALQKAYLKYGIPVPEGLYKTATQHKNWNRLRRDHGNATNNPTASDEEYLTQVQIGTPPQTLTLDFDSGSSDLWVFSSETPSNDVNGQTTFNIGKSTSAKKLSGASWKISYGDGSSSSGDVYTDTVVVGGVSVSGQAVESATTVSSSFTSDSSNDGLLGLAFSSINTVTPTQQKTWFDNAKANLDSALWTADLKHQAPGSYDFGIVDSSKYTGTIGYADIDDSQGFWSFTNGGWSVKGGASGAGFAGIADTGTTLMLLDDATVSSYYKSVSGAQNSQSQGGWVFDCSATLPDFSFTVGGTTITVPGDYINYAQQDGQCFGGIQSNAGIGFSILGDVALKSAFVIFDQSQGSPRIGWAAKST